jgi:hypothetical protein
MATVQREAAIKAESYAIRTAPRLSADAAPPETLRINREFGDSLSFARVEKLYHLPGKLLAMDPLLSYHLLTVDLATGGLQHFGRNGDGPREFREPYSASIAGGTSEVWIYDFRANRFTLLDLSGEQPVFRRTTPAPQGVRLLEPVLAPELISNALSAEATLVLGREGKGEVPRLVDLGLPFDSVKHPFPIARRLLNRSFMSPSPDYERAAIVYQFTNRIDIVSKTGLHLATAIGPRPPHPSYRMVGNRFFWNDDNVALYGGVTTSGQRIYALYCGCRYSDAQEMRIVQVFDWQGNFLHEFAFDRPVAALAAAADDSTLYGYVEEPYPMIVEWRVPPFDRRSSEAM